MRLPALIAPPSQVSDIVEQAGKAAEAETTAESTPYDFFDVLLHPER